MNIFHGHGPTPKKSGYSLFGKKHSVHAQRQDLKIHDQRQTETYFSPPALPTHNLPLQLLPPHTVKRGRTPEGTHVAWAFCPLLLLVTAALKWERPHTKRKERDN